MNINTERIKNKKFAKALCSKKIKNSQEYRVLATLRYLFPSQFETMKKDEVPDLKDEENGIGIEVVAAVKQSDVKASHDLAELLQEEERDIEKYKKKIERNGYSFFNNEKDIIAICTASTSNGEQIIFQESIRSKLKKLKKYRENFQKIGLAVIMPEIPTSYAEEKIPNWILEVYNESHCFFNFVYVISHRFCIYYDAQNEICERKVLSPEENQCLSIIGRMTAEKELSLKDEEWL